MKKYYMKNKCIGCSKLCSGIRCRKCQDKKHSNMMKGKNNNFFGKHFTKEENPNWKGILAVKKKKYFCLDCRNKIGYQGWKKTKRCRSCSKKGKRNPMYGKSGRLSPTFGRICSPPKKAKYKRVWMRSSWEVLFAQFLDLSGYKFLYESKTFDLGNSTYTPDFYLPEFDLYIEIKGQFSDYAKNKINKFRKLYSNINFELLKEDKLKQLGVLK